MKKSYSELLLDPRWQRKRLEILQSDNFQCRQCSSKTETLHIHHLWYEKNKNPWEYPNECLITLCKDCHSRMPDFNWQKAFLDLNITEEQLLDLALYIQFKSKKYWDNTSQEFKEKYKTRLNTDNFLLSYFTQFDSVNELNDYFKKKTYLLKKYTSSKHNNNG